LTAHATTTRRQRGNSCCGATLVIPASVTRAHTGS
jgi:hypothetical protein